MVYLFNVQPLLATSYSLFVVGSTSLFGAANNYKRGLVNINTALLFGLTSIVTVFLTRKFLIASITGFTVTIAEITVTESMFTMVMFALLMMMAAVSMIKTKKPGFVKIPAQKNINVTRLLLYGIGIGFITGLLGAGGGFLLIPTLVIVVGLPMKEAVGTSLLIIALNSLIGFTGDLGHFKIDWKLLTGVTAIAIAGIFIGGAMAKQIPAENLKKGFGWFVLVMGIYIIIKELFLQ